MSRPLARPTALLALIVALAACQREPEPTPAPTTPTISGASAEPGAPQPTTPE